MDKVKKLLKKIFCLPPLPTVLIAVPSFIFVFTTLALGIYGPIAYVAYLLSAYAMVITCTGFPKITRAVKSFAKNNPLTRKIMSTALGSRFLTDMFFRAEIFLYPGLFINLLYAGIKLFFGIRYRSIWFGALAVYYILLAVMRSALIRAARKSPMGSDMAHELKWYRFCGIGLLLMNQALAVIVIFAVHQNQAFDYPGLLIYAMALYSFYAVISAVTSLAKNREQSHGSPVMSATKIIKLTAALVSMLSLETAMLARFDGGDESGFRQVMTSVTGGAVCVIVLAMAIFMIVSSGVRMKKLTNS